jgi:hypothetical protein
MRFASRKEAVRQLRERLESGGWPRLQMLLLVALTGAAGFVSSFALLLLGLRHMGLRYLLACCVAYVCFLALLSIWLHWRKGDAADAADSLPDIGDGWSGGGGRSGGGGASAGFDASAPSTTGSGLDLPNLPDLDVDAEAIPILLAVVVAGLVLSSLFVVWTAPALFAELLLDGVLAAGLYRRLRHIETRHWLQTALRKTAWPFVLTTGLLTAAGFGLQAVLPQADSFGDALQALAYRR